MRWSPGQVVLRIVIAAPPLACLVLMRAIGAPMGGGWLVVVAVLSLVSAWAPDSAALAVAVILVVLLWGLRATDPLSPWLLVVTGGLLLAHVAAVLADHGPRALVLPKALWLLWGWRTALAMAAAVGAWWLARVVAQWTSPAGLWPIALVVVLALMWWLQPALRLWSLARVEASGEG